MWPAFRALGATTNTSGRLRFGEVDCMRDRGVCSMMKAEKQPVVRIYRAVDSGGGSGSQMPVSAKRGFKREPIAEWSGLLIAYEFVDWFKGLQTGPDPILGKSISWAPADELGAAMRRFKARGKTQHDSSLTRRPSDPAGYLIDAELAFAHGLTDHAFPYADTDLEGARLTSMLNWLELQSEAFPKAGVRAQARALRQRLANRPRWDRAKFEAAVKAQGLSVTPPDDSAWRWCDMSNGRGGYSCALWVLFHATLANLPRQKAPAALDVIAAWVNDFFGCEECASHFIRYYEQNGGRGVSGGQIGAVLWLWRAHNVVSARLASEEVRADGASDRPARFPAETDCNDCYNATDEGASDHTVFEYLQEVYCFESDTCAPQRPPAPRPQCANIACCRPTVTDRPLLFSPAA